MNETPQSTVASADRAEHALPPAAAWMGYLGLLPFFATALGVWIGPVWLAGWLLAYGAIILSFVGAIHWGLVMGRGEASAAVFQASVVPALVGWAALLVPTIVACRYWWLHLLPGGSGSIGRSPQRCRAGSGICGLRSRPVPWWH